MDPKNKNSIIQKPCSRRTFLKGAAVGLASLALPAGNADASVWEAFFQKHFKEMNDDEIQSVIKRLQKEYADNYGVNFNIKNTKPLEGTLFGYGLDLSRCIGCRRCVYACVKENNQSMQPQIHWITVLRFKKGEKYVSNLEESEAYYAPKEVPEEGHFYMPTQCQQCENPPCVKVCPTQATWKERDGIVVVDYNWCIGCRYCMAACPYGARHFNWGSPQRAKQ
ncbi:MAG: 4Fe-4S dicluster domain-containing protein [Nitrospirae bacterium]|nr:4Fe-4S dicluster domain-containing protein [Nitrospirota bacterium]